jgi:flagellar biosynthesis chaperone FliJ
MARDPLRILLSVRRRSVEQARYALGACLAEEAAIAGKIVALDDEAARDRATARAWPDSHQFKETAAMRLAAAQAKRQASQVELTAAEDRSTQARGIVAAQRAAAEAVEQLIQEREAAAGAERNRREQHSLDDIARFAARRRHGAAR